MKVGLILETAEAREVHHICVLLGYGADAICPYLVFEMAKNLRADGVFDYTYTDEVIYKVKFIKNYRLEIKYNFFFFFYIRNRMHIFLLELF